MGSNWISQIIYRWLWTKWLIKILPEAWASDSDGQESGNLECLLDKVIRGSDLLPTTAGGMYSNLQSDCLLNCVAKENQKWLMVLSQTHANTANRMDPSVICHQHIKHNFNHVHGLLRELRSDLKALWELKTKGGEIFWKIESVWKMMKWGDSDKEENFILASV